MEEIEVVKYMYSRGLHLVPVRKDRSILVGSNRERAEFGKVLEFPLYGITGRTHFILDVDIGYRGKVEKIGNLTLKSLPLYKQAEVRPEYVVISRSGGIHLYYRKSSTSVNQKTLYLRDIDYITAVKWVVGPTRMMEVGVEFSYEGLWDIRDRCERGEYTLIRYSEDLADIADDSPDGYDEAKIRGLCKLDAIKLDNEVKKHARRSGKSVEEYALEKGSARGIDAFGHYKSINSKIWTGDLPERVRRGERDNALYAYITKLRADGFTIERAIEQAIKFYDERIEDKEGISTTMVEDKVRRIYEQQGSSIDDLVEGLASEREKIIKDAGGGLSCIFRGKQSTVLNESEFHSRVIEDMFDDDQAGLYAVANGMKEGLSYILVGPLAVGPTRFHHLNANILRKWMEAHYSYVDDKGKRITSYEKVEAKILNDRTDRLKSGISMVKGVSDPDYINLWIDPRDTAREWHEQGYTTDGGIIDEWIEFQTYLLGAENVSLGTEWVAFLIQRPKLKPAFAVMLESERFGVGKSLWSDIICRLMGVNRAGKGQGLRRDLGELFARFFDAQGSLIFLDEVQTDRADQRKLWARMKTLITESTIVVEPKGKNSFNAVSTAGVIIAANSGHNLNVYGDSRRLWHIKIDDHLTAIKRFPTLHRFRIEAVEQTEWYKGAFADLIRYYEGVKITSPIEYLIPPMSMSKVEMLNNNMSLSMRGFLAYLKRRGAEKLECIPVSCLIELVQEYTGHQGSVDELLESWKVNNRSLLSFRYYDAATSIVSCGKISSAHIKNQVWWCFNLAMKDLPMKDWVRVYYAWLNASLDALDVKRNDPARPDIVRKAMKYNGIEGTPCQFPGGSAGAASS